MKTANLNATNTKSNIMAFKQFRAIKQCNVNII